MIWLWPWHEELWSLAILAALVALALWPWRIPGVDGEGEDDATREA